MSLSRFKYLVFVLVDIYFTVVFFSERAAQLLPFFIAPFVFILFLAFFQNPKLFIKQWNSCPSQILKFSFLLVGTYVFFKAGQFPILNDFLVKGSSEIYLLSIGKTEGMIFVFLATFSQMCFIIGIIFNSLAFSFPSKFSETAVNYKLSFAKALIPTIILTLIFILGLPYIGSMVAH